MKFKSFKEFYPYYLSQHRDRRSLFLHFVGTSLGLALLLLGKPLMGLALSYLLAWCGHFAFEGNRPASFKNPIYSFMGDMKMYWQMLTLTLPKRR
jgi:hypothetical protein